MEREKELEKLYNKPTSQEKGKKIRFGPTSFTPSEIPSSAPRTSLLKKDPLEKIEENNQQTPDESGEFEFQNEKEKNKRLDVVAQKVLQRSNVVKDPSSIPQHLRMLKKGEGKLMNCPIGESNYEVYQKIRSSML